MKKVYLVIYRECPDSNDPWGDPYFEDIVTVFDTKEDAEAFIKHYEDPNSPDYANTYWADSKNGDLGIREEELITHNDLDFNNFTADNSWWLY